MEKILSLTIQTTESNPIVEGFAQTRQLTYQQTILCSVVIGIAGGLVATAYYYVLEACLHFVWHTLPDFITPKFPIGFSPQNYIWIVTTIGGLLVGLTLRFMGLPGEVSMVVDKVHDPGLIEIRQTPAMIVASLFSITAGGSAGPEAPLVQIIGSFGGWLGKKLKVTLVSARVLTFCGMSAALGAFFGAPVGGALFALEIPHRRGLEYYEALIPAILSAILSFFVFRLNTGLEIGAIYHFGAVPTLELINLVEGAILGVLGALVAILFVVLFRSIGHFSEHIRHHIILLATLGGLSIGLIALVFPQTLFFGEKEIETIVETGSQLGMTMLLMIAFAKMLAICCTLHSGFRGGFIFPLFYVGAAVGFAVSLGVPQIHPTIAMICMMAAVNVAITKTPISTTVILSVLSGTAMIPVIAIASFVSFLLTIQVSLIKTQRSRSFLE
ncbi:chloride channel protein [Brasilonema octagenarum UFV-E1]|uniref:Chloride channel protein n=2 Tax=Brasilonema TaxID=383614 RepID=A0A856MA19_9CYAN|nr:chloride channel protein [Brasilonema octagenarum UFV-OR1]QDL07190.1 chloride channel protein [Brasilonema sennae CENA114]QDL13554.1 chloride channel protein [Brasilonema octagenarum UFV-E1]